MYALFIEKDTIPIHNYKKMSLYVYCTDSVQCTYMYSVHIHNVVQYGKSFLLCYLGSFYMLPWIQIQSYLFGLPKILYFLHFYMAYCTVTSFNELLGVIWHMYGGSVDSVPLLWDNFDRVWDGIFEGFF